MDARDAHLEHGGNFSKIELLDEEQLQDHLQPFWQLRKGGKNHLPVIQRGKTFKRIRRLVAECRIALIIGFINRADLCAARFDLADVLRAPSQGFGEFSDLGRTAKGRRQRLNRLLKLAPAFDRAAAIGEHFADVIKHRPAHAQFGIGREPVVAWPIVPLSAFGQRDQADLHQILNL